MDNLTHGLLGLAIGALRRPDPKAPEPDTSPAPRLEAAGRLGGRWTSPTDRAVLLGCVIAAELPDLDTFFPAGDPVLHALKAHRGISHALVLAPVWALVATWLACLVFRRSRPAPVFLFSLISVLFAHLAADLWTGWGTRLLLPFSDQRLSLDLASVIDPFVTLPLLVGAGWAVFRRRHWRKALLVGLACATAYLGARAVLKVALTSKVEAAYVDASRVDVFPAFFTVFSWRYVATLADGYAAGDVSLFWGPKEAMVHPFSEGLTQAASQNPTVREALEWARFPVVESSTRKDGLEEVRVADLRYHLGGEPTLEFVILLAPDGSTMEAELQRGGTVKELLERRREIRRGRTGGSE